MSSSSSSPPSPWTHFIAGGIGAGVGATLTCPLELVKTRLQSSLYQAATTSVTQRYHTTTNNPIKLIYRHMRDVSTLLRNVARDEGVFALWRGLGPTLIGVIPARAISFGTYNKGKHLYSEWFGLEGSNVHMLSAATAGIASACATNPIWLVKTRMQLQSSLIDPNDPLAHAKRKYKNSLHCVFLVLKEEGIRGLYRGLGASFLGVSESTIQFVAYEKLKKHLLSERASQTAITTTPSTARDWTLTFLIAAFSKLVASSLTYPHEVLRTRLRQTPVEEGKPKYTGLIQATRLILKEEGWIALYGGMTAHLMRVVPNAAIVFWVYEGVVALTHKLTD